MRSDKYWFEIWCERDPNIYTNPKILTPDISNQNNFTIDSGDRSQLFNTKVKSIRLSEETDLGIEALLGILNSNLIEFIYRGIAPPKRGGYRSFKPGFLSQLPISPCDNEELIEMVNDMLKMEGQQQDINLNLLDYIQPFSEGRSLTDIGIYQPGEGVGNTKLIATKGDYSNLRIGSVSCERQDAETVIIYTTARYQPEEENDYETDRWGYTETELIPAMRLTDLTEIEANLIESFVPVAVDEAGGFANFRETATKTNSLVDRLEALTLPDLDDVRDGLHRYREAKERAEELDEKIERTDERIDEIVYELYGLTDEEIEIVEEAVGD